MWTIRRLGPGDEGVLTLLAAEGARFEFDPEAGGRQPLDARDAAEYLADPSVLHWIAEEDGALVGHLMCLVQRRRSGEPRQVLLYEIGVSEGVRRRGIGQALVAEFDAWCAASGTSKVWVLADNPAAERFYEACGFKRDEPSPVQMSRRVFS